MGLLAAEITARTGRDPDDGYRRIHESLGSPTTKNRRRRDAEQKEVAEHGFGRTNRREGAGGGAVTATQTRTPGGEVPIGGVKVIAKNGWFAARPSGTEEIYKIYAESFVSEAHLRRIQEEAQAAIAKLFKRKKLFEFSRSSSWARKQARSRQN